ncbi:MAG TPA: metallophosphoesterase, partial [Acetobacteraceae bacterium]|nr:metallophosphoesterase [Acetobacteraceae bacterium]
MAVPFSFRDPLLSLFQSAARDVAEGLGDVRRREAVIAAATQAAAARTARLPLPAAPPPASLGDLGECAHLALAYLEAAVGGKSEQAARLHDLLRDSPCDPLWISTLVDYLAYFGPGGRRRAIPYIPPETAGEASIVVPHGAKIVLLSDWGTGSEQAEALLREASARQPDLLIHLGDIYYSGTERECRRNFSAVMDRVLGPPNGRIPVFTLSGNHDMYSGGDGYYGLIAGLNAGPWKQRASYFCLRSADHAWQLVAMDTGLHDHDPFTELASCAETSLEPAEEAWHLRRITEFEGPTILLSHHPMFSAFREIGPRDDAGRLDPVNVSLAACFERFRAAGRIAAWFWGHEHNLCIYQPYAGLARGRCVGNGAVPVLTDDEPYRV